MPKFLINLSHVHSNYEVIGMSIGQGLIFFLGYICLKNKEKVRNIQSEQEENYTSEIKVIGKVEENLVENSSLVKCKDLPYKDERSEISETINKYEEKTCEVPNEIDVDIKNITWKDIENKVLKYQKEELITKCSPSNFIHPYNHDAVQIANDINIRLKQVTNLMEIKPVREIDSKINVFISPELLFIYLKEICNPALYTGKENFSVINDLYSKILESRDSIDNLEILMIEAQKVIKLGKDNKRNHIYFISSNIELIFKHKIISCVLAFWISINFVLWVYKGTLYNCTDYLYPFQTHNIMKFDYTEFLLYGILPPILILGIYKLYRKLK